MHSICRWIGDKPDFPIQTNARHANDAVDDEKVTQFYCNIYYLFIWMRHSKLHIGNF